MRGHQVKAGPPRLELGMPVPKTGVLPITPRASDVPEMIASGHALPEQPNSLRGSVLGWAGTGSAASKLPEAAAFISRDRTPHAAPLSILLPSVTDGPI